MLKIKVFIVRIIASEFIGNLLALIHRNNFKRYACEFDTSSHKIKGHIKALLFWNLYEKQEANYVQEFLSGDYPVIELGGSIGIISSVIGKKLKRQKTNSCRSQ